MLAELTYGFRGRNIMVSLKTRRTAMWSIFLLSTMSLAGAYFAFRNEIKALLPKQVVAIEQAQERPAQPVRITQVVYSQLKTETIYTGTIRPNQEINLGFRLGGKLLERLVSIGDSVKAGQTLARLDDADGQLELQSIEAELTAAATELKRATSEAQRSRKLQAQGFVSRAAFDLATATQAEAQGRVDRATRARDLAINRLDYLVLKADSDGVVTTELAEAGQVVQAGQPILSIAATTYLNVVFAIPEHSRNSLETAKATAQIWDDAATDYELSLRDMSPDVDQTTRTYRVRMSFVAPDARATLGRTVSIKLSSPPQKPVAILPLAAVLNDGSGASVWRLTPDHNKVERIAVTVESVDESSVMINSGLIDGDFVVSLGAYKIDPSRPVRVVETTTAAVN
jgi:RND family efflux transporter MFP subunit